MRFKKYLNEEENNLEEVFSLIKKECKHFLKDLLKTNDFLYSGRKVTDDWFKRKVRKNRKPTDMPLKVHNYLDELFYKEFGVKSRSNALFCTGNENEAVRYGDPYIIFPVGKYKIIWSPEVEDLFRKLPDGYDEEEIDNLILNFYQEGNLKKAIESKNEIMLICDSYYAIHNRYKLDIVEFLNKLERGK